MYMDTSWQPRTSAVALAAVAASSSEYSVGACIIDSVPDGANLGLRAIQQGPCLACCVPQACTQRTYHRVYAFTDCAEALCFLIGIPCRHSAAHCIKHYCCSLHQVSHTAVAVRWIPGHVGLAGNKSAHTGWRARHVRRIAVSRGRVLPEQPTLVLTGSVADMLGTFPSIVIFCFLVYPAECRCF